MTTYYVMIGIVLFFLIFIITSCMPRKSKLLSIDSRAMDSPLYEKILLKEALSFKARVNEFWASFLKNEGKLRKMMDDDKGKNTEKIMEAMREYLHIAFVNPSFQIGINDDNMYELMLSIDNSEIHLLQNKYWLEQAPKHLLNEWIFHAAKPAIKFAEGTILSMFGIDLNVSEDITF